MVVQCPSCQTKFRIADEKVTDRGVRVRCTSCKSVFQVKKSGAEAAANASQAVSGQTQELQALPPALLKEAGISVPPPAGQSALPRPAGVGQRTAMGVAPGAASHPPGVAPHSMKPPSGPPPVAARPQISKPPPQGSKPPPQISRPPPQVSKPPPAPPASFGLSTASAPGAMGRRRPSSNSLERAPAPAGAKARPGNGERSRATADDLFGMDELVGNASANPGSPLSSNPNLRAPVAPPIPPPPPQEEPPPAPRPDEPPPADAPGTTDPIKIGAIKPARRDPFEGIDLADSAPRPADEASQPAAEDNEPPQPIPDPSTLRPGRRELVAVLLTGLIGITLALAVAALARFTNKGPAWLRGEPAEPLVATQITSGLYDSSSDKPIFFVRGRVENHSALEFGPVRVIAELTGNGGTRARAETMAGSEPSPEEVHAIHTTEEASALGRQLARLAVEKHLKPGGSLPFFALIADPPADAERDELKVRLEPTEAR